MPGRFSHNCPRTWLSGVRGRTFRPFKFFPPPPPPQQQQKKTQIDLEINFTHIVDELSFGEYFPNINNPLDYTHEIADESMLRTSIELTVDLYRFQYFLSVVPTVYVADDFGRKIIETNQYAVTQQSYPSTHGAGGNTVPGPPSPTPAPWQSH